MSFFQINTLKDGQWIRQDVKLEPFANYKAPPRHFPVPDRRPELGLLSRTVIDTPVIRSIVPARIRSPAHNDIVFIGDRFIRVCELRADDQFYEIGRKTDFDPSIIHARVIGYNYEDEERAENAVPDPNQPISAILDENAPCRGDLPLQILVLFLKSHEYVFIFMGSRNGQAEFVSSRCAGPHSQMVQEQGLHFAIDPESRYMATAFPKSGFCVSELESFETLRQQYRDGQALKPLRYWKSKITNGYVIKIDFLHPREEDPEAVILLLILRVDGDTKIMTYQWRNGENLHDVLRSRRKGYLLLPGTEIPTHVIPLTVKSSFCLITETTLSVCEDILIGNPTFQTIEHERREATPWYHGTDIPLWTSWARPYRRKSYYCRRDNIYVAREDGIVVWLEFQPSEIIATSLEMGDTHLSTSIDTAFTTVSNGFNDVLIIGGDCGNGSIWKAPPRKDLIWIGNLPNWSPCLDITSNDEFITWNQKIGFKGNAMVSWHDSQTSQSAFRMPDRVFVTSGRGINGGITEHRVGMPANIGIEFDYTAVREVWMLPQQPNSPSRGNQPLLMLLSQRDSSDVLLLSLGLEGEIEVQQLEPEDTFINMDYRTLDASCDSGSICQITEKSLALCDSISSSTLTLDELLETEELKAEHASIGHGMVALAAQSDTGFKLHLLKIHGTSAEVQGWAHVSAEITCLHVCNIRGIRFILAGLHRENMITSLAIYNADSLGPDSIAISEFSIISTTSEIEATSSQNNIEAFSSIKTLCDTGNSIIVVGGTRDGYVVTLALSPETLECNFLSVRRLDVLPVSLSLVPDNENLGTAIVASSNTSLIFLGDYQEDHSGRGEFKRASSIFPGDSKDSLRTLPGIHYVSVLPKGVPRRDSLSTSILMVTSGGVHIAELEEKTRPAPRLLLTPGAPKRVLFSHTLNCLVVSTLVDRRPNLVFIDPDTGENLSVATSRAGNVWPYISGLGDEGDRIMGIKEWVYTKDGSQFLFFLVCLQSKKLLIVSTSVVEDATKRGNRAIKYWTRHKIKGDTDAVYCAHASGQNLYYSSGNNVNWSYLDNEDKKFKLRATLRLKSPVFWIEDYGENIIVMTAMQSILVVSPQISSDSVARLQILNIDPCLIMSNALMSVGPEESADSQFPVTLLGDREQSVMGRWISKSAGVDIEPVFEGSMKSSIRKFCRARSQPSWWHNQMAPRFGRVPSTVDDAEIFGVAMDGTVEHYTLLDIDGWKFLSLVQKMAQHTEEICPFNHRDRENLQRLGVSELMPLPVTPALMYIDGNMIQRCLDNKALDRCFFTQASRDLLQHLLGVFDGGQWTSHIQNEPDPQRREELSFELAYKVIEYFLRPVI
ncbi:hypothetical protein BROUX41_001196 [Berkeleyomyces rouxiae]|uniref:uncharacterized protein n=1 Tax=Berkeleyomyces rouxiae TaxID=2035830 RepID=UPI003B793889